MSLRVRLRRGSDVVRTDVDNYLANLARQERRSDVVACFDLDRTLIAGYSVMALAWERMRSGLVPLRRTLSSAGVLLGYGLGRADYHDLLTTTVRDLAGESEQALADLGERAFRHRLQGWIYPQARTLIDTHRSQGHHIVMVTSATRFQAEPVARELQVDSLCCTELESVDGYVTGKAWPCFGVGKLNAVEHLLHQRSASIENAFFYSDSSDDLPLLEAVGRPVVVNPRTSMARLARSRGWPCLVFDAPGETRPAAA
ncbi:MAG: HAD family hydrolase [Gammaproteobacteria bacterium]|nr:HAD family hydrolase [Gammaproteobacteria bacterium]